MFARLFSLFQNKEQAYAVYGKLVSQARNPVFYQDFGVADDIDGRFDMILLHLFIVDRRFEKEGDAAKKIRRQLQEAMIADMDRSLREMGVGDMSIGKEVKKMGAAWFGRVKAYSRAIQADAPKPGLAEAIAKNVYKGTETDKAEGLASYTLEALQKLAGYSFEEMLTSQFEFPDIGVEAK